MGSEDLASRHHSGIESPLNTDHLPSLILYFLRYVRKIISVLTPFCIVITALKYKENILFVVHTKKRKRLLLLISFK